MLNAINTGFWALGIWCAFWMTGGALWIVFGWPRAPQSVRDEVDRGLIGDL
jgi:hypothetical protein